MTQPASGKKRILVIDDETSIAAYLLTVLEDQGYEALCATDAERALEIARQQAPDLITMDIMMPRRSGIRLYRELMLDPHLRDIPVIFISAFSRSGSVGPEQFRKLVPDERIPVPQVYFEKPVVVPELVKAVAALLAARPSKPQPTREEAS